MPLVAPEPVLPGADSGRWGPVDRGAGRGGGRPLVWVSVVASLRLFGCLDPGAPGALVPATVAEDPSLPSATVVVGGVERRLHLREEGDPERPTLLVLPGAACDMRAYLPLEALADDWHVVFFDLRGNGLSERVPAEELRFDGIPEEIEAVRAWLDGSRPVVLLGHSWSAAMAVMAAARSPDTIAGLVLVEPPALRPEDQAEVPLDIDVLSEEYLDLAWAAAQNGPTDHAWLDYKTLGILPRGVESFLCDPDDPPTWPVWRPGGLALVTWQREVLDGTHFRYDFAAGIDAWTGPTLFVATECSTLGRDFQEAVNLPLFPQAELLYVEDSGHRVPQEQPEALVAGLRAWLEVHYGAPPR